MVLMHDSVDHIATFIDKMEHLMVMEKEAELEQTADLLAKFSYKELERRNLAITKLYIKEVSTGVYGRVLVTLTRN